MVWRPLALFAVVRRYRSARPSVRPSASRPYVVLGLPGERALETRAGIARLFLDLENLTNVRQTRDDPLLLPPAAPAADGPPTPGPG